MPVQSARQVTLTRSRRVTLSLLRQYAVERSIRLARHGLTGPPRAVLTECFVCLLMVVLALYGTRPLARHLASYTLHGPDPDVYIWTVDWLSGHLLEPRRLFEGNIYFPTPHAALLSDLSLGTALLVAPFRMVIRDPVALYNLGVLLTLAFGGWAFYRLGWRIAGNRAAGLLVGILAAFGSHQLVHVYQLGLINIGWMALFLLALDNVWEQPGRLRALAAALAFSITALSSGYYAVAASLMAVVYASSRIRRVTRSRARALALGALTASLILTPYIRAFRWLQNNEGIERPIEASIEQAFQPRRDLTSATYLYGPLVGTHGQRLFPGIAFLFLAVFGLFRRPNPWRLFLLTSIFLFVVLSLGPVIKIGAQEIDAPYALMFRIPPLNAMLHPYTFAAIARLLLALLAGIGFARIPMPRPTVAWIAAVALGLAETAGPGVQWKEVPAGVPPIYDRVPADDSLAILDLPPDRGDAMIWAARHRRPVINGAGAMSPRLHARVERWIHRDWIKPSRHNRPATIDGSRALRQLRRLPVGWIIVPVGRSPHLRSLRIAFDDSRSFERIAEAEGDVLYRLLPEDADSTH
ncbi:MAG: hypothetical protein JXO72_01840 [Vicinamibacteria bacterium]|nr:hypothetical protein [Vicinamibacteria bacterium]